MSVAVEATEEAINFGPRRLGHVNLWVGDYKRNTKFYNEVLGFKLEATEPGILGSFLGNGNTHHDIGMVEITTGEDRVGRDGQILIPKEISNKIGLFHLGWEMENEAVLVEAIDRLKETDQPIAFFADHQLSHSIYIPDPDGFLHEFYADEQSDWKKWFKGELELITGVWNPGENEPHREVRYDPNPELYGVDSAPLHPRYITHSTMIVSDFTRALHFYEEVAGLKPISVMEGSHACFEGGIGRYVFSFFVAQDDDEVGMHHCSFELESEEALERSLSVLKEQGVAIEKEVDNESKRSLFVLDDDKIRWEFFVERERNFATIAAADPAERPYLS